MKQFWSLSQYPGKTGEHFYNSAFKQFDIDANYRAIQCDRMPSDLHVLNISGFSISMPYKKQVIELLDDMHPYVYLYSSCNTIVNIDNKLIGYNTDYNGAIGVIKQIQLLTNQPISILGDGAMGNMFKAMLPDSTVYSNKLGNWHDRYNIRGPVINCTALGTISEESPFLSLPNVTVVADLALKSNILQRQCSLANVKYIGGIEFYKYQFMEQFKLYTGKTITIEETEAICSNM